MATGAGQRRPRADAQRNVARLVAAADDAFGRSGTDAPLEQIARAAGVAIGTLYGHFPHRRALIAAVLRERHVALFAAGEELLADRPRDRLPGDSLAAWVRAVAGHAATYRGLAEVIAASLGDEASELHADCARLASLTHRVAVRARRDGALRRGVSDDDLVALMNAAAWVRVHHSPRQADRLIDATLAGLRPV